MKMTQPTTNLHKTNGKNANELGNHSIKLGTKNPNSLQGETLTNGREWWGNGSKLRWMRSLGLEDDEDGDDRWSWSLDLHFMQGRSESKRQEKRRWNFSEVN